MRVTAYCTLAALLLTAPLAAAQPAASAPGGATFNVFLRSTLVGFEQIDVVRTTTGWTIRSRGVLSPPIDLQNTRFEIDYDERWYPRAMKIDGIRGNAPLVFETTFGAAGIPYEDAVVLPEYFFGSYEALSARLAAIEPGDEIPIFVPPQATARARLNQTLTRRIDTPAALIEARVYRVSFLSGGPPLPVEIWTNANQRLLRVSIPDVGLDVAREDIASVTAHIRRVTHAGDEDARIQSEGFSLAATVTVPVDHARPETGWPAVLLIPGSAATDRDGTVAGTPVLGQLANALADAGYLTLRYDKRGTGQSGGRAESAAVEAHAADARALVRYLGRREDVDDDRVTLVGYADGGWVAMVVARRERRRTRNLVLVGVPGGTGAELIMEQQRSSLDQLDAGEQERADKIDLQQRIIAAALGDGTWRDIPEPMRRQADTIWFRSFLDFDADDALRRTRQPLLIIRGGMDTQTGAHHADRLAQAGTDRRGDATVELATLDGVNHVLVDSDPTPSTYDTLSQRPLSASFVSTLTAWLARSPE